MTGDASSSDHLPELFHIKQDLGAVQKDDGAGVFRVQFRLNFAKGFDPQISSVQVKLLLAR